MIADFKKTGKYDLNLLIRNGVIYIPKRYEVANIGEEISFTLSESNSYLWESWKLIHYDLLTVAAAVEYADRWKKRKSNYWPRHLNIKVPVYELDSFNSTKELLCDTLKQLTGDDWHFVFVKNLSNKGRKLQGSLSFPDPHNASCVMAYSDGLDSRCVSGIYNERGIVKVRVAGKRAAAKNNESPFDIIPFKVNPSDSQQRESSARSRGFKFAVITAIAGHLANKTEIIVPESGQGALGPVLLPLHGIYPDYRNHPVFFRKMEKFIGKLLKHSVQYTQPQLWQTKGQTVRDCIKLDVNKNDILDSRSCWQQRWWNVRWRGGKLRQCGLCAACLLRRLSLHAASIDEPADTYTFADLSKNSFQSAKPDSNKVRLSSTMVQYGIAGTMHLQQFAHISKWPINTIQPHALEIATSIGQAEDKTLKNLRKLSEQHAEEWQAFLKSLGKNSFINEWITKAHYDRY